MYNDFRKEARMTDIALLSDTELRAWLEDAAKLWLAHDGLWFQAVEDRHGMEEAIRCDTEAWRKFSPLEAGRIRSRLKLPEPCALEDLAKALQARLYALLNEGEAKLEAGRLTYTMKSCRVQEARKRRGLPDFPCTSVGIVEYSTFAETLNPKIQTRCLACPPDGRAAGGWCAWEFTLKP
jgi:predicted transcriptional regulator